MKSKSPILDGAIERMKADHCLPTTISDKAANVQPLKPALDGPTHTLGRWGFRWDAANNRHVLYSDTDGDFASFIGWASDGVTTEAEDEKNLRLISSAPDLLAALQAAVAVIQGWEQSLPADIAFVADAGRAAIAKAGAK